MDWIFLIAMLVWGGYACTRGKQDENASAKRYRQAAENWDVLAQFRFGEMYFAGQGVGQDDVKAVKWFRLAAKQGHESRLM